MSKKFIDKIEPVEPVEAPPVVVPTEPDGTPIIEPVIRQIEMKQTFRGRQTKERLIDVGVYDETDPRLFGLAAYLVRNDFARWLE